MKLHLTVRWHFDAAHFLHNYTGVCKNMHGHRWLVDFVYAGEQLDGLGMLVDFKEIKEKLKSTIHEEIDHKVLNEVPWLNSWNPTAETIAIALAQKANYLLLKSVQERGVRLFSVTVYETPETSVTAYV